MSEPPQPIAVKRRLLSRVDRSVISAADAKLTVLLPFLLLLAWLVPTRQWHGFCRTLFVGKHSSPGEDAIMRGVRLSGLSPVLPLQAPFNSVELRTHRYVSYLQYLRDYRPLGWRCAATIDGEEALRHVQAENSGVILWVAHFVYNGLPLKKALHQAGYSVSHLSRPEHGFSDTRYGVAILNPLRSRIEERYLRRRILIKRGAEHVALREAHRLLKQGAIVSITAGHWEGRQVARIPVGQAVLPLSTGAPSLAHATGAPLLPVFISLEENGDYRLRVGEALRCDAALPRSEAVTQALSGFSQQLLVEIRRSPTQWRGWKYLEPAAA